MGRASPTSTPSLSITSTSCSFRVRWSASSSSMYDAAMGSQDALQRPFHGRIRDEGSPSPGRWPPSPHFVGRGTLDRVNREGLLPCASGGEGGRRPDEGDSSFILHPSSF